MAYHSFSYSNNISKSVLDNNGLNENVVSEIINNPEYNNAKFLSWDGSKLINKNELPSNYKTCQNIVITKNILKYVKQDNAENILNRVSSQSDVIVFLI